MGVAGKDGAGRWSRRSGLARGLRLAVLCGPVAASVASAWAVHSVLPPARGFGDQAWHLAVLVMVSTVALLLVDRLGRRLLPLVTLLDLNMLFPDRAPSRLRVAREAIRRRPIEEQLSRVRRAGADPGAVATEILTLVAALSAHDKPTRGHAERVRMFTDLVAEQMGLPRRDRDLLRWAAILHDIGKLRVPSTLLNKPGKPTDEEWAVLRAHPSHGAEMAAGLLPWLDEWADVIVQHHERYDGTGYPEGLRGTGISLGARIVSVADAYDVMTAARAYKRPVSRAAALQELVKWSGSQFDPAVVRAMVAVGAPRLRRAQGVVAWLADIPIVASGSVPAATVARVVGAGALATGTMGAAPAVLPDPVPTQTVPAAVVAVDRDGAHGQPSKSDSAAPPAANRRPRSGPASLPTVDSVAPEVTEAPGPVDEVSHPAAAAEPPKAEPAPRPSKTSGTPSDDSSGGSQDLDDTVDETVKDPVGKVTDTVDETVKDPVGTVTGTVEDVVEDPLGTVTGTLGGLTGGGSQPSPSPSPSPTQSGGLLGGLLGR